MATLGIWAHLPYLEVELRRVELWKAVGLFTSDLLALVWFARFAFDHGVRGQPLCSQSVEAGRRTFKTVAIAGTAAVVIDLIFALYVMRDQRHGYETGLVTDAQVFEIKRERWPEVTWYELECRFSDVTGSIHHAHLRVGAKKHVLPKTLPTEVTRLLGAPNAEQGQIRVRYDPRHPPRAWVEGMGFEDNNDIYWFSILTLFFQAILTFLLLLFLYERMKRGSLPWWWSVYKPLPFVVEIFWMLVTGLIDRFVP
jgi:hypothetical protein